MNGFGYNNNSWLNNSYTYPSYIPTETATPVPTLNFGFHSNNNSVANMADTASKEVNSTVVNDKNDSAKDTVVLNDSSSSDAEDEEENGLIKDSVKRSKFRMSKKNTIFKKVCLKINS